MEGTIITILVIIIISLGAYKLIKKVCMPIKTSTTILLVVPTVLTCGIALFIYRAWSGSSSYSGKSYSSGAYPINIGESNESKKTSNKKAARSFTDVSGKTTYYYESDNIIGTSMENGHGSTVFTDVEGNYAGSGFNNGLGNTIYKDKDGNIINNSITNYAGEEMFSDGTTTKSDSSGNKYYN
ncbi:MAG: hypothetical protein Q4C33_01300 [bacterium]|nr:hypothetical protein [bacterium]